MKIPDNFIKFFDKYLNKDAYSKIFGAKIQIVLLFENILCSLRSQCCKMRLFNVIFKHCVFLEYVFKEEPTDWPI